MEVRWKFKQFNERFLYESSQKYYKFLKYHEQIDVNLLQYKNNIDDNSMKNIY